MTRKTKIKIDYQKCGDGKGIDPRSCAKCLKICKPAIFILHETLGAEEENPFDPQKWRITPLYPSLCNHCLECVQVCPIQAIAVNW